MTRRSWRWLIVVSVLAVLDLSLTVHTALTWRAVPGGPTVMPAGELLGWASSAVLVVWIILILIGAVRSRTPRVQTMRDPRVGRPR